MSDRDIEAGARWGPEVGRQLEDAKFGILFVSGRNVSAPWLLFEAGALAKAMDEARVCPLLIDLEPENIPEGPLSQFQAKRANKKGLRDLVASINRALGDRGLSDERLQVIFEKFWPDLEKSWGTLPDDRSPATKDRPTDEMIAEILRIVRQLARSDAHQPLNIAEMNRAFGGFRAQSTHNLRESYVELARRRDALQRRLDLMDDSTGHLSGALQEQLMETDLELQKLLERARNSR